MARCHKIDQLCGSGGAAHLLPIILVNVNIVVIVVLKTRGVRSRHPSATRKHINTRRNAQTLSSSDLSLAPSFGLEVWPEPSPNDTGTFKSPSIQSNPTIQRSLNPKLAADTTTPGSAVESLSLLYTF